ncbi:hypothetical protein G9A89_017361 [Geosiphon pyriformis]|nr:hypothetical protein G9A89_017361 [Geosiphon pyriformis]
MELVNVVAGVSGSSLTGLETCLSVKKKCVDNIYFHGASYKKPKKSVVSGIVDTSAGLLNLVNIGSEVGSIKSSISGLSDLENMKNVVAEKTNYADLDNSVGHLLKAPLFDNISNNDNVLELLSLKFKEIIRSSLTSELSLNKTRKMAICEKILVNNNVRKPSSHSNQKIIVKEISVDLLKLAIVALVGLWQKALIEFRSAEVANLVASMWSVLVKKNSVCMTLAINNKVLWILRDMYCALLYTLPVSTTVYDLSELLASYDKKTYRCVIVCFKDKVSKLATIGSVPVFKGISLQWAVISAQDQICLASIYKKKQAPIAHSVFFGVASDFFLCVTSLVASGFRMLFDRESSPMDSLPPVFAGLSDCLASLECFLELLADQVSDIVKKLSFFSVDTFVVANKSLNLDMALNGALLPSVLFFLVVNNFVTGFSLNSLKVLTTKVSGLESKIVALEVLVRSVLDRLDCLCSGLVFTFGLDVCFAGTGVAIIMNNFLACHVAKVEEVPGWVIVICLLFKGKLLVVIIGLYAGAFFAVWFGQVLVINSIIVKVVNSSTFVVSTWGNLWSAEKTLNYIFVSENLLSAVAGHGVGSVSAFFDTNHKAVMMSIELGGLLDLLVAKLVKKLGLGNKWKVNWLINIWSKLNDNKAIVIANIIWDGLEASNVLRQLLLFHKEYKKSKMYKSKMTEELSIQAVIKKCMEKFCSNKSSIIRSVLDYLFYKVVFDHLVVDGVTATFVDDVRKVGYLKVLVNLKVLL